jgi:DNA topoisomerase-1
MEGLTMRALIITEKPRVSQRIASVLFPGHVKKKEHGVAYYEFKKNGMEVAIASAAGHLFSLAQKKSSWDYPLFDVEWVPIYRVDRKKSYVKKYLKTLSKLAEQAEEFFLATDYDIEGEVLGYNVLRYACSPGDRKIHRMKFSTLTKGELLSAYEKPIDLDYNLVSAGEARHIMDWYWGINTSRALIKALKKANSFATISAGRVQTPALAILVAREEEIARFKPRKYWELFADLEAEGSKIKAQHADGRIFKREKAEVLHSRSSVNEAVVEEVRRRTLKRLPPTPFDLGGLQAEAYRCFGYSPKKTQDLAQTLYEGGYISYPRTSSQKLPPAIDYRGILEALKTSKEFSPAVEQVLLKKRLKPRQGSKDDPAHPAIYPTGNLPRNLSRESGNLYRLVVYRFITLFGEPLERVELSVRCSLGGEPYLFTGVVTLKEGWAALYPFVKFKDLVLPPLEGGDLLRVLDVVIEEKETRPPPRYNQSSLVKELERRRLGTKATRAEIVDTLYRREYVKDNPIRVTEFGCGVIEALWENVPELLSEELTRSFEEKIDGIRAGDVDKEEVLQEAREKLTRIMEELKEREGLIGQKLKKALVEKERMKYVVGECPTCGGTLRKIKSRKTGKVFVGCSNYPKCSTSYPLPQNNSVETTNLKCKVCGLPLVRVRFRKTRVLSCIDLNCKSKERSQQS